MHCGRQCDYSITSSAVASNDGGIGKAKRFGALGECRAYVMALPPTANNHRVALRRSSKSSRSIPQPCEALIQDFRAFQSNCLFHCRWRLRTGILIIDIKDASDIPRIAELWFLALNAASR
jgi:hypothetical protein